MIMEKIAFGSRAQDIAKVDMSVPSRYGSRPTYGAISTYRTFKKLTLRLFSVATISWMQIKRLEAD